MTSQTPMCLKKIYSMNKKIVAIIIIGAFSFAGQSYLLNALAPYFSFFQPREQLSAALRRMLQTSTNVHEASMLLKAGADINGTDPGTGYTPLMAALTNPSTTTQMIRFLIQNGTMINARANLGTSAFILACQNNVGLAIMRLLIKPFAFGVGGADVTAYETVNARTPLNYLFYNFAYTTNNQQVRNATLTKARLILDRMVEIAQTNKTLVGQALNMRSQFLQPNGKRAPETTLMWLAYIGDVNLLRDFLRRFSTLIIVNQQDSMGRTAYDWATNPRIQKMLLSAGAQSGKYMKLSNRVFEPMIPSERLEFITGNI